MKAIKAYFKGWTAILDNKRLWLMLYLLNFCFAIIAAIPLSGLLSDTLGQSLAAREMLTGFNYTFFTDMLNEYGEAIWGIFNQSVGYVLLFFFLSVFLMGGILFTFIRNQASFQAGEFWQACGNYFWRLFRLTFYFLIIHGLVLGIFVWLYFVFTGGLSPLEMENEAQLIHNFQIIFPIYLLVATLFFMIHDYAKIHLVAANPKWLNRTLWQSFAIVFKNLGQFGLLYLLNILTFLILYGIYFFFRGKLQVDSVLLLFLLSQVFIFGRIGTRLLNLSSASFLYQQRRY